MTANWYGLVSFSTPLGNNSSSNKVKIGYTTSLVDKYSANCIKSRFRQSFRSDWREKFTWSRIEINLMFTASVNFLSWFVEKFIFRDNFPSAQVKFSPFNSWLFRNRKKRWITWAYHIMFSETSKCVQFILLLMDATIPKGIWSEGKFYYHS